MDYTIRPALKSDEPFLWQMLYYAAHMDEDGVAPESAHSNPDLAYYVEDWAGRRCDLGFIAIALDGSSVGAAWIRAMLPSSPLYKYVPPGTPELAIATLPEHIGKSAGTALLRHLLNNARATCSAVALSVRVDNPARRLYKRFGFVTVAQVANRVGTISHVMELRFSSSGGALRLYGSRKLD
jgi:ribosomal protein S18 acetylase RimI-like enzyme